MKQFFLALQTAESHLHQDGGPSLLMFPARKSTVLCRTLPRSILYTQLTPTENLVNFTRWNDESVMRQTRPGDFTTPGIQHVAFTF